MTAPLNMHVTLWSRDSLLGDVELNDRFSEREVLVGPFHPTDAARDVLPLFADAQEALMAIGPMLERRGITRERLGDELGQAVHDALHDSPEGARVQHTRAAIDALALALRDASGRSVPLEHITIQESWPAELHAGASDEMRARVEEAGLAQFMAAVVLADKAL